MNLSEYFPVWISSGVIVFTLWIIGCVFNWNIKTFSKLLWVVALTSIWWLGFDLELEQKPLKGYTTTKVLVSTNPSESYTDGSFSLSMGTGSGEIETKRWYLLREEIRKGLYKDFTVKKDVFIEERDDLPIGKGLFEQNFSCKLEKASYRMFVWTINSSDSKCYFEKQTIAVPTGFVIKEIKI